MRILAAHWLLPISSPPVKNGAIAIDKNSIVSIGTRDEIAAQLAGLGLKAQVRPTAVDFERTLGLIAEEPVDLLAIGAAGQAELAGGATRDEAAELARVSSCSVWILPDDAVV